MPLTPPPRRAPAPHTSTRGWSVSTPQLPTSASSSANGHAGRGGRCCRRAGRARPRGRAGCAPRGTARPSASRHRQSSIGSASTLSSERSVAASASPRARRRGRRRTAARACAARSSVSVCAPAARSSGPRIDRVGQRVAVDLARHQRRAARRRRPARTRRSSWRSASLTWNVPANASRGSTARVAQPRQPREQHVDLQLRALGRAAAGARLAEQPVEHRGRDVGEHVRRGAARAPPVGQAHLGAVAVGLDRGHLGAAAQLGARRAGGARRARR